jgi:hypothetical protein
VTGRARVLALFTVAGATSAIACSVDEVAFQARVFECDTAAVDPRCGSSLDTGEPMTCFPASQIDGVDFCAPSCGEPGTLADGSQCVQGNARLAACNPAEPKDPATGIGPCGRRELDCLRTDVTSDEGVCVTMHPCDADSDCPNPVRSTCAATFLNQLYTKNHELRGGRRQLRRRPVVPAQAGHAHRPPA